MDQPRSITVTYDGCGARAFGSFGLFSPWRGFSKFFSQQLDDLCLHPGLDLDSTLSQALSLTSVRQCLSLRGNDECRSGSLQKIFKNLVEASQIAVVFVSGEAERLSLGLDGRPRSKSDLVSLEGNITYWPKVLRKFHHLALKTWSSIVPLVLRWTR